MPSNTPQQNNTAPDNFQGDFSTAYSAAQTQSGVAWGQDALEQAAAAMGNAAPDQKANPPAGQTDTALPASPASSPPTQSGDIGNTAAVDQKMTDLQNTAQTPLGRFGYGAAKDITLGMMQAPRSALRGAVEGVNAMAKFATEAMDYLPTITNIDKNGNRGLMPHIVEGSTFNARLNKNRENNGKQPIDLTPQLPVPDAPKTDTVTGGVIEGISQFLTGFGAVGKLAEAGPLGETVSNFLQGDGKISTIAKGALGDLFAFDQHQQRLSNIIQQVPALQNPVTNFLQAKPDDTLAEGKAKQAIEGVLGGSLGEALFGGISLLKKGMAAAKPFLADGGAGAAAAAGDATAAGAAAGAKPGIGAESFGFMGDPNNDSLLLKKQKLDQAAAEVQGAFGKTKQVPPDSAPPIDDYEINFARINTPDDIHQLMDEMVNKPELKPAIDVARRGTQTNADTLTAVKDIDGFNSLMQRRTGDAFNAEQIVAARRVYNDTSTKLMDAAKAAAEPNAGAVDQFNFRRMLAVHQAVQKEFMGVRAEAGRALQAWSIPVGLTPPENLSALEDTLNAFGGAAPSQNLAQRIAAVGNNLNATQLNAIVQNSAPARTLSAVNEAWTLGLLTNPTTHVVNLASNTLTSVMLAAERFGQAAIPGGDTSLREGVEFTRGMLESFKLAAKNASIAFKTGESGIGVGKIELPMARSTSREILDPDGKAGVFSKAIDWYGGVLAKYAGGALTAADEFSKTVLYQAELRAEATRQGIAKGLDGDALSGFIGNALQDPSPEMQTPARTFAQYGTFTRNLGEGGRKVQSWLNHYPALRFIAPFVRTPTNIFKFGFERTPLAVLAKSVRDDIGAGGVRRAQALTRIGMGSTIMMAGMDMALQGQITGNGPSDQGARAALRQSGWQPYSIKLGDKYYSYSRFEPVATIMGMAADMAEILSNYESYDIPAQENVNNIGAAAVIAMGNQVVGKTFLKGFSDITLALSDPEQYGEQVLRNFGASFVPAGSAAVARAVDPNMHQVMNMMDAMKARIPGLSESVPPRRNIWGEPIKYFYPDQNFLKSTPERMLSLINPVYYTKGGIAPLDRWMSHNGFNIGMPQKIQNFDGVRIDLHDYPKIYDRLVELRGSGVKLLQYGNLTMRQFFDTLAHDQAPMGKNIAFFRSLGNNFDDQQNFISKAASDYQAAAKKQVMEENKSLFDGLITQGQHNAEMLNAIRQPLQQGGQ